MEALAREVEAQMAKAGLPAAQWAVALRGEVVASGTVGAPADSLFVAYSITKAFMASLTWLLAQEGLLEMDAPVGRYVPQFAAGPKAAVTVSHLLTHTAGFPNTAIDPMTWGNPDVRSAQLDAIELEWAPGERFEYHRSSSMWVLTEVIERVSGQDYRTALTERVLAPLGLAESLFLGLPEALDARVAAVSAVGEPPPAKRLADLGLTVKYTPEYVAYLESYNSRAMRERGLPSGGIIADASSIALFFQALMGYRDGAPWRRETIADALVEQTGELLDPMTGKLARRALGVIVAGDKDKHFRGFGMTCSEATFGHPGAGGQAAWADPKRGISFVFLTSGLDRDPIRQGFRMVRLSTMVASAFPEL